LAVAASGAVAGYLVGSASDDFAGMGYAQNFRELAEKFPAHLHVNLAPAFRDRGLGGRLISAFLADVKRSGAGGAHVVTSADSRNVRFYNRNGFIEAGRSEGSNAIVFLARSL
jgi:ribosomal protein S18 acetylase RimI-like enzyme